ncbi:MAG: prolyl aminopeptidase [Rhodospirillaceae bacterium]|nr:prolyl aminopeptidase [Rhodospirillaceae bacterium]OUT77213.1 MAG: prolyl aminopeptidase [Rhodospirillaceae bacterium TMED23]
MSKTTLYPHIEPYKTGLLKLDNGHEMYWELSGNPNGFPALVLHGGPGAGASASHREFFDPEYYKIIIFDQRGSGRSKPFAEIQHNTTQDLLSDMELLRQYLNIKKWLLFGGSWGSSLALIYGINFPQRVAGFILRGVFLCSQSELDWFLEGIKTVFPDHWSKFRNFLPPSERNQILNAYYNRLVSNDPEINGPATIAWANFEGSCSTLLPSNRHLVYDKSAQRMLALARIEAHYFINRFFLPENYIYMNLSKVFNHKCTIVQGRYDMVCPMVTADKLNNSWNGAHYKIIHDAGHSAMEPLVLSALVEATEDYKVI